MSIGNILTIRERLKMKKLIEQLVKFGLVGVLCTIIDFGVYTVCNLIGIPYLISGFAGFTISVIVNYVLSMKYVFERRDDMSKQREFVIFVILSIVGLVLNEILLYIGIDGIYMHNVQLQTLFSETAAQLLVKLGATAIVMIYNFVSRKILLEKKSS